MNLQGDRALGLSSRVAATSRERAVEHGVSGSRARFTTRGLCAGLGWALGSIRPLARWLKGAVGEGAN